MDTLLYIVIRDPQQVPPGLRPAALPPPTSNLRIFRRATIWNPVKPKNGVALDEHIRALEASSREVLSRSDRNPAISGDPDAPLFVDWINAVERNQAQIRRQVLEIAKPAGEMFCILIDRTGTARNGSHLFPFPMNYYVDFVNARRPADLAAIEGLIWSWIEPAEVEDMRKDWLKHVGVDPRQWSWLGDWEDFSGEQAALREFVDAWQADRWSRALTDRLGSVVQARTRVVQMDREPFISLDWRRDDFEARDRWTGTTAEGARRSYTPNFIPVRLIYGIWGLPYAQLEEAVGARLAPGTCPDCGKLLPPEPRRHRDRRCDMCRLDRDRRRAAERSHRHRRRKQPN